MLGPRASLAAGLATGVVLVAATAGVVEWEGRRYRDSAATRDHLRDPDRLVKPGEVGAVTPVRSLPPGPPAALETVVREPVVADPTPPVASPPAHPPEEGAPERAAAAELPRPAAPVPVEPSPPPLPEARPLPAFERPKRAADLTPDEERRLGEALHAAIVERHLVTADDPLLVRVARAAAPLLRGRESDGPPPRFFLLDSPEVVVFSHPGGAVYLARGFFALVADDAELQFALARELEHLDRRDAERAIDARRDPAAAPDLVPWAYHQIALGYGEADEFAADERAYRRLRAELDRSPREALGFLRRLSRYAAAHGFAEGRSRPATGQGDDPQDIANHTRSAPAAAERLRRLEALEAPPS